MVLSVASLLGDALVIRILRRIDGLAWLRWSAVGTPWSIRPSWSGPRVEADPAASARACQIRWYAIAQARLTLELPARGGTAVAVGAPADLVGVLLPLAIASVAETRGLHSAMWLLLGAPIALLTLLPSGIRKES